MTLVDVNNEYKKAKTKMNNATVLFIILFALTIIISYVLIITRENHVKLNMIFTMIVSIAFVFYAISFFSLSYPGLNNALRFYEGFERGIKVTDIVKIKSIDNEIKEVNGFDCYPMHITVFDGIDEADKTVYVFDRNININKKDKLSLTSYQRIVISIEAIYDK